MPARLLDAKKQFKFRLPESLMARVYAELYSDVEGCVPYGKVSEFIESRIREYFDRSAGTEQIAPAPESGGATLDSTQQPASYAADPAAVAVEGSMTCPDCLYELVKREDEVKCCINCGWTSNGS